MATSDWLRLMMISLGSSELRRTTEEEEGGHVVFFSRFTREEKQEVKKLERAGRTIRAVRVPGVTELLFQHVAAAAREHEICY